MVPLIVKKRGRYFTVLFSHTSCVYFCCGSLSITLRAFISTVVLDQTDMSNTCHLFNALFPLALKKLGQECGALFFHMSAAYFDIVIEQSLFKQIDL